MYLYGVQALQECGKSDILHLGELVGEDRVDRSLVVDIVREVHVDLVGADVGVLGRVYTREVLVFEKDRVVRRDRGVRARWLF